MTNSSGGVAREVSIRRRALRGTVFDTKDAIAMFTKAISQGNRPVLKLEV